MIQVRNYLPLCPQYITESDEVSSNSFNEEKEESRSEQRGDNPTKPINEQTYSTNLSESYGQVVTTQWQFPFTVLVKKCTYNYKVQK